MMEVIFAQMGGDSPDEFCSSIAGRGGEQRQDLCHRSDNSDADDVTLPFDYI